MSLSFKKTKKGLVVYNGENRVGRIVQKWVNPTTEINKKNIKVYGKLTGFRSGWHELTLDNEFVKNKDWTDYIVIVRCPTCKEFCDNGIKNRF